MDVDVQINGATGGNAGVIFRASNLQVGANSYQAYYVGIVPGSVMLGKADFGWTLLQSVAVEISANNMHHIRILAFKHSLVVVRLASLDRLQYLCLQVQEPLLG
jgi:hypothetical protein